MVERMAVPISSYRQSESVRVSHCLSLAHFASLPLNTARISILYKTGADFFALHSLLSFLLRLRLQLPIRALKCLSSTLSANWRQQISAPFSAFLYFVCFRFLLAPFLFSFVDFYLPFDSFFHFFPLFHSFLLTSNYPLISQ